MGWKAAEKLIRQWKILRGDSVMIIICKAKGETGLIKRVIRSQNRVIVEGKNLAGCIDSMEPTLINIALQVFVEISKSLQLKGDVWRRDIYQDD
ncbi:uncharacterized protein LOC133905869 [Phragmites australis]|uniref:uncharacterized protein LOC133905869 n=1 Tax=Phragmites australis TaxID=29695 RepID=UPI002D79EA91|nr:uncharacterized protein LOC133905869 [Phragmites australis]